MTIQLIIIKTFSFNTNTNIILSCFFPPLVWLIETFSLVLLPHLSDTSVVSLQMSENIR